MHIEIKHSTHYNYSEQVSVGTHYLFFHPMNRPYLRLVKYEITTDPSSSGLAGRVDTENNVFYQLWFTHSVNQLKIEVVTQVELTPFNPYNFLIDPPLNLHEPVQYHSPGAMLEPYLEVNGMTKEMELYLDEAINRGTGNVLEFFQQLNQDISQTWSHEIRLEENILTPDLCYHEKRGSCRDLSWMLMNMLRSKGFATRFVSGYSYVPGMKEGHELHAWVEVLLPGAGWLAMDPTLGLLVTETHIPLAASYDPAHTLPVQGSYHGKARSEMTTEVVIKEI